MSYSIIYQLKATVPSSYTLMVYIQFLYFETNFSFNQSIIPGNSNNRGTGHRLELYKVLQDLQYHVIAFDYRSQSYFSSFHYNAIYFYKLYIVSGYGDSSWTSVSEIGVVEDAISVYQWALEKVQLHNSSERSSRTPIYIWGHSLGQIQLNYVIIKAVSILTPISVLMLESKSHRILCRVRVAKSTDQLLFIIFFNVMAETVSITCTWSTTGSSPYVFLLHKVMRQWLSMYQ